MSAMKRTRPELNPQIDAQDFLDHYWLKVELVQFCRSNGLPRGGGKKEITGRIASFLRGEAVPVTKNRRKPEAVYPEAFDCSTVIGPGWRCTQSLRAFFVREVGPSFRFTKAVRDFVATGVGQTLQEAVEVYLADQKIEKKPIEGQFEYNRFTREYYEQHPGATRGEVVAAWKRLRATPYSQRSDSQKSN